MTSRLVATTVLCDGIWHGHGLSRQRVQRGDLTRNGVEVVPVSPVFASVFWTGYTMDGEEVMEDVEAVKTGFLMGMSAVCSCRDFKVSVRLQTLALASCTDTCGSLLAWNSSMKRRRFIYTRQWSVDVHTDCVNASTWLSPMSRLTPLSAFFVWEETTWHDYCVAAVRICIVQDVSHVQVS